MSRLLDFGDQCSFVTSYLPGVLKSRMAGLLDVQKSLLTCRAKLPHEKNGVFNRASSSSWQAFGQLGRAVENLAVRSAPFSVRSRRIVTDWVEIRVFLCL